MLPHIKPHILSGFSEPALDNRPRLPRSPRPLSLEEPYTGITSLRPFGPASEISMRQKSAPNPSEFHPEPTLSSRYSNRKVGVGSGHELDFCVQPLDPK